MNKPDNEKGIALVTALLFLTVMGLLSTALIFTVQNEMRTSTNYKYNQQAFHVADAGIEKAVNWYRHTYTPLTDTTGAAHYVRTKSPVEYNTTSKPVYLSGPGSGDSNFPDNDPDFNYVASYISNLSSQTLAANTGNSGVYDVRATLMRYRPATFIDLSTFEAYTSAIERWAVTSTGYWGDPDNPMGVSRIEAVIENSGNALFDRGLWGIDSLTGNGGVVVDSFDPAKGLWDEDTNNGDRGSIGSNLDIVSNGNIEVNGDVGYGPLGSYTVNGGAGIVTGGTYKLPEPRYFPPLPDFTVGSTTINATSTTSLSPGLYGTLRMNNGDVATLSGGTYYFDDIAMTGGAIVVTGPVTIYVKSGLSIAGQGIIHPVGTDPQDVKILYSGTSTASLVGGSEAFIELYAPEATVTLGGGGEHHGSFIGKDLVIGGDAHIHFNEGKDQNNLIQRPFRVLSWSQKTF